MVGLSKGIFAHRYIQKFRYVKNTEFFSQEIALYCSPDKSHAQMLLDKSEHNFKAFLLLKEHKYLTPCVHCGYYSCFQKVVYILENYFPDEYRQISEARRNRSKGNLHKECIEEFVHQFRKRANAGSAKKLHDFLIELKSYRIEADYNSEPVTSDRIEEVGLIVEEFRRLVKTNLHI